ncbi:MAG TPA: hypothetical protein VMU05_22460 [Dongiaceae bacterium]|nr:hypothetical protein [Dongiaceae bacterium]
MKRISILLLILVVPTALFAQNWGDSAAYPVHATPFGMTYGDWQAAYLQWFFSVPASINPAVTAGADCNVAQSSGPVFYLPTWILSNTFTQKCTVPASKNLLLFTLWWECSNIETPPSYGANPQDMRACAAAAEDGVEVNTLKLTVDRHDMSALLREMRHQSPYYDFTMPATDNILGLDGVTSGSSVSDGYTVMLKPLSPGKHVIHFEGTCSTGPGCPTSYAFTEYLTVQ